MDTPQTPAVAVGPGRRGTRLVAILRSTAPCLSCALLTYLAMARPGVTQEGPKSLDHLIAKTVDVQSFNLVTPNGARRASLSLDRHGMASLEFIDTDGETRLTMGYGPTGAPQITMRGSGDISMLSEDYNSRVTMTLRKSGEARVGFFDGSVGAKELLSLGTFTSLQPVIYFADMQQRMRMMLNLTPNGSPSVRLLTTAGSNDGVELSASDESQAFIGINDKNSRARVGMDTSGLGQSLTVSGGDGSACVKMSVDSESAAYLSLFDAQPKSRILLSVSKDGKTIVHKDGAALDPPKGDGERQVNEPQNSGERFNDAARKLRCFSQ